MKELQRKRHSARPDVSIKGRVRKVAKWQPASDDESDEDNDCESLYAVCMTLVLPVSLQYLYLCFCISRFSIISDG